MVTLLDEPLLTVTLSRDDFDCIPGSVYIYSGTSEQRSAISEEWSQRQLERDVTFIEVTGQGYLQEVSIETAGTSAKVMLSSTSQTSAVVDSVPGAAIYLDVTGLGHHVTAPFLRAAVARGGEIYVVYTEPGSYRPSRHPQRVRH